jgi:hypothetical protein
MLKHYLFILAIWLVVLVFWALPALAETIVDTAWVRTYNGPGDSTDWALDLALDSYGNAYVTGISWNGTDYDYATIKYYPNGDTAWVRRFHSESYYELCAVVVDSYGNVYVSGKIGSGFSTWDYVIIKYYPDGATAWVRTYNGPGDHSDAAIDMAVDALDNILVTGVSKGAGTDFDYAIIKYYPNGDTAWIRRYNGPDNQSDAPHALTVDNYGNVYVTGGSWGSGTSDDFATIKYYNNGDTAWVRRYNGTGNSQDYTNAIAVDNLGNIYVTDLSWGTYWDIATIKYFPNGDTAWVRRYEGPDPSYDASVAIAVDDSGNTFVAGATSGDGYDFATIKYHPNGDTAWVRKYDGPAVGGFDFALAISVDSSGNSYVSGYISGETGRDNLTIKYYPNGDTAWVRTCKGTGGGFEWATDLALDCFGNVYVSSGATSDDYVTIKYFQTPRGDANGDGVINIADVVYLINFLFIEGPPPNPFAAGDANCSGYITVADVVYLINYLFARGSPPDC